MNMSVGCHWYTWAKPVTHGFLPTARLYFGHTAFRLKSLGHHQTLPDERPQKKHDLHPTCKCNLIKSVHGSVGCAVARPHPLSVLVELTPGRTYKICTCVRPCETLGPGHMQQARVILPTTNGMSTTHVRYTYVLAWQPLPLTQLEFVPDSKTEYQSFFSQRMKCSRPQKAQVHRLKIHSKLDLL